MWKRLRSPQPLSCTLPSSVDIETTETIDPKDLNIFNFYASLVQSLSVMFSLPPAIPRLASLSTERPGHLLSNLRSLEWLEIPGEFLDYILLFLHKDITTLHIYLEPDSYDESALPLLARLHTLCPNVRDFSLVGTYSGGSEDHDRIVSEVASRWNHIHSLSIAHLSKTDLHKVAAFPHLRYLEIRDACEEPSYLSPIPGPVFPALR